jgi:hypothetical protein
MNPWLAVLLCLIGVLAVLAPRNHVRALVLLSLLALIPISPSLMHSGAVPGSGHVLELPPWSLEPQQIGWSNRNLDDIPRQIYPWMLFTREELRSGRWPTWNPYQGGGTPLNGQAAPASPWTLLFAILPVNLGLLLVPWSRALVAGVGTYALGREVGLSAKEATISAVIYELCSVVSCAILFPMGSALALVPWAFLAALKGRPGFVAVVFGLQFVSGHPHTGLQTALLVMVFLLLSRGWRGGIRSSIATTSLGLILSAGLSAGVWLPVLLNFAESVRWSAAQSELAPAHFFPLALLFFPDLFGNPAWDSFVGPYNYLGTGIYVGGTSLFLAGFGALSSRETRRWAVLAFIALGVSLSWPVLREGYHLLPGLGRASFHRIRFGFELAVALLAGFGMRHLNAGPKEPKFRSGRLMWTWVVILLACQFAVFIAFPEGRTRLQLGWMTGHSILIVSAVALFKIPRFREMCFWPLVVATVCQLSAVAVPFNGYFFLDRMLGVSPPTVASLQRISGDDTFPPNLATIFRIRDLRVNDTAQPLAPASQTTSQDAQVLNRMGVGVWLDSGEARQRKAAQSMVRWSDQASEGGLKVQRSVPGRWTIVWSHDTGGKFVVAEFFNQGWTVSDGVTLRRSNHGLLELEVGPGEGVVELVYRPRGQSVGSILSAVSFLILIALSLRTRSK